MDIDKIGQFIKELRKEKNISQNQLSEEIHVTRQAISAWENGKAVPDSDVLLLLSSYFNVSINEILLGKRLTEDEGLEEIALQLIDDNNRKIKKIKKLIISFTTIIVILLLIFQSYYFINNYNSVKVYKVNGKSSSYMTHNGIFIMTNNKVYLRLGKIFQYGSEEEYEINKVKLYYKDEDNKEYTLFEENKTDILIDEDYGYKEFFLNNNVDYSIKNMYLEITYNEDQKETIKLKINEKFKNNFMIFLKKDKIKVLKDEINLQDLRKREDFIDKLTKEAKLKVEEQIEIRKQLDTNNNPPEEDPKEEENYKEETHYIEEPHYEELIYETPIQEEIKEVDNIVEENKIIIEEPIEEPIEEEPETIDYDIIINIIKENGSNMGGTYIYEFMKDEIIYSIYYSNNIITIEIINNNIYENIQIFVDSKEYSWQKLVNYNEEKYNSGLVNENQNLINIIKLIFDV